MLQNLQKIVSPYFEEFMKAENEFKKLVNLFNQLTLPKKIEKEDSEDSEENYRGNEVGRHKQVSWIQEDTRLGAHTVLNMDDMVKERDKRVKNMNQQAREVNSLATEVNHSIFRQDDL